MKAFLEADAYDGPSIIIAYSHCIAHGYDLADGLEQQKLAVDSGYWPLYRYDPRRLATGENPLHAGLGGAEDGHREVHGQRDPLPRGRAAEPGAVQGPAGERRRRTSPRGCVLYEQMAKMTMGTKPAGSAE